MKPEAQGLRLFRNTPDHVLARDFNETVLGLADCRQKQAGFLHRSGIRRHLCFTEELSRVMVAMMRVELMLRLQEQKRAARKTAQA